MEIYRYEGINGNLLELWWKYMELVDRGMVLVFGYNVYIEIMKIFGNIVEYGYDGI